MVCPECGRYMGEDADECVHCGYEPRSIESKIRDDDFSEYSENEEKPKDPEEEVDKLDEEERDTDLNFL